MLDQVATEIETRTQEAGDLAGPDLAARALASVSAFVQLLVDDPRKGRVAIVEAAAMPSLRPPHRADAPLRPPDRGVRPRAGPLTAGRPRGRAGRLAVHRRRAELVTAWLDGVVDATPDELVAAAARSFLALYR